MYGSHLSIAGGMHNAIIESHELGLDCVQVFTKNQRQWRVKPLTDEQIDLWNEHKQKTNITRVVSHASYLINLASPVAENLKKSIALFREELLRCDSLGIADLVMHPGAHMKEGETVGLKRVAGALDQVHKQLPGLAVITCLEVTAGQGTCLGAKFEHIRQIIDLVKDPERLAVCLDTAHMIESGYDLTCAKGCRAVLQEFDDVVGLDRVHVLHLNDSKTAMGSRVDRHEHIGHGHVDLDAFGVMVRHKKFKLIPKILETPKAESPDGRPWDTVNLEVLRGLAKLSTPSSRKEIRSRKGAKIAKKS